LKLEAGDVLWQLAGLCTQLNLKLEDVAQANLDKLTSRKQRGVIDGNGDHR
jgi:MazG nucleotide pyrophosphohydrolase domain.